MKSITKNKQSLNSINNMVNKAFGDLTAIKVKELTEGYFNVAYLIELSDNSEVILKIAPKKGSVVMTHEINIMRSEVTSMQQVARDIDIPVARILFYDDSHNLCDSDYFFMSKLEGQSFDSIMESLPDEIKKEINIEIGKLNHRLNEITNDKFGYYGQSDKQDSNWYQVFTSMIGDAVKDALAMNIDLQIPQEKIFQLLQRDKDYFLDVITPRFVHWDLWAGNVFIHNNKISGLIDFERCMWADELMEVGFRTFWYNEKFLLGYGIEQLSRKQQVRARWYDVYLLLIMILECDYRKYETRDTYNWSAKMLKQWIADIQNRD